MNRTGPALLQNSRGSAATSHMLALVLLALVPIVSVSAVGAAVRDAILEPGSQTTLRQPRVGSCSRAALVGVARAVRAAHEASVAPSAEALQRAMSEAEAVGLRAGYGARYARKPDGGHQLVPRVMLLAPTERVGPGIGLVSGHSNGLGLAKREPRRMRDGHISAAFDTTTLDLEHGDSFAPDDSGHFLSGDTSGTLPTLGEHEKANALRVSVASTLHTTLNILNDNARSVASALASKGLGTRDELKKKYFLKLGESALDDYFRSRIRGQMEPNLNAPDYWRPREQAMKDLADRIERRPEVMTRRLLVIPHALNRASQAPLLDYLTLGSDEALGITAFFARENVLMLGDINGLPTGFAPEIVAHELAHGYFSKILRILRTEGRDAPHAAFAIDEAWADIVGRAALAHDPAAFNEFFDQTQGKLLPAKDNPLHEIGGAMEPGGFRDPETMDRTRTHRLYRDAEVVKRFELEAFDARYELLRRASLADGEGEGQREASRSALVQTTDEFLRVWIWTLGEKDMKERPQNDTLVRLMAEGFETGLPLDEPLPEVAQALRAAAPAWF